MEIPESVSVLGLRYEVRLADLEDEDGACSPSRQLIQLRDGMGAEKAAQTFYHELLHALLDQLGYSELYGDEHLVQGLAIGLHQALGGPTSSA